eukprot:Opistho-2@59487
MGTAEDEGNVNTPLLYAPANETTYAAGELGGTTLGDPSGECVHTFTYVRPSVSVAIRRADSTRIKDQKTGADYPLNASPSALVPYGAGLPLMLEFEAFCAVLAFVFACIYGIPAAVMNHDGHLGKMDASDIFDNCTRTPDFSHPPMYGWFLGNRVEMPGWPYFAVDAVAFLLFVAVSLCFRKRLSEHAQLYGSELQSVRAYTVMCKGLPANATDASVFVEYFSRWGRVARVTVSLDSMRIMRLMDKRHRAVMDLDVQFAKQAGDLYWWLERLWYGARGIDPVERAKNRLARIDAHIYAIKQTRVFRCTGYAFVTFATPQQAAGCLAFHNGGGMILRTFDSFMRCLACRPPARTFMGRAINVKPPPEPSDIMWQNLDVKLFARIVRNVTTGLVMLFVVALGFSATLAVILFSDLRRESETKTFIEKYGTKLAVGLDVIFINWVLSVIVRGLCAWEKHHTHSSLQIAAATKLFICSMTNTAYSVFAAYLALAAMSADPTDRDLQKAPAAFGTSFWYSAQGASGHIFWSIVTGVAMMMGLQVFRPVSLTRKAIARLTSVTQQQLDEGMKPEQPDLPARHVTAVVAVYTSMFYASQMPLLPFVAGCALTFQYMLDKYNLLRRQRPPPKTNGRVTLLMMRIVTWAASVHVLLSGLSYVIGPWCNASDPIIFRDFFGTAVNVNTSMLGSESGDSVKEGGLDLLWWHVWVFGWLCAALAVFFLQGLLRCTLCAIKDVSMSMILGRVSGLPGWEAEWPEYETLIAQGAEDYKAPITVDEVSLRETRTEANEYAQLLNGTLREIDAVVGAAVDTVKVAVARADAHWSILMSSTTAPH